MPVLYSFIGVVQIKVLLQKKLPQTVKLLATVLQVSYSQVFTHTACVPVSLHFYEILLNIVFPSQACRGCPPPLSQRRQRRLRPPHSNHGRGLTSQSGLQSRTHLRVYTLSPWSCTSTTTAAKNRWCLHPWPTSPTGIIQGIQDQTKSNETKKGKIKHLHI